MKFRRHHNNDGRQVVTSGATERQVRAIAKRLDVPYGSVVATPTGRWIQIPRLVGFCAQCALPSEPVFCSQQCEDVWLEKLDRVAQQDRAVAS